MLVLTRKKDEKIYIAGGAEEGGVTILVVRTRDGSVKLGIDAHKDCPIVRAELIDGDRKSDSRTR